MPNHVYQKIRISDWNYTDKFKELKKQILNENNEFDFSLLIPQPKGDSLSKNNLNRLIWGTKWNAYGTDIITNDSDTIEFTFQTAWNVPTPIIEKILEIFKGYEIRYLAVDEGGFFAIEITQDEDGLQTQKDLKEHFETLLFALP